MHVIGFIHEHQREDRDRFVRIVWANVIEGLDNQPPVHGPNTPTQMIALGANADFEKLSAVGLSNYGEIYDYFSIMHYESTEGSRNGESTIEAKISKYTPLMGKSTDFTQGSQMFASSCFKIHTNRL
jgi:astacin